MHCKSQMPLEKAFLHLIQITQTTGNSLWEGTVFLFRESRWLQVTNRSSHCSWTLKSGCCVHLSTVVYTVGFGQFISSLTHLKWCNLQVPLGFRSSLAIIHCCYHQRYNLVLRKVLHILLPRNYLAKRAFILIWKLKEQEITTQRSKNEKVLKKDYSEFIVDVLMYVFKVQNQPTVEVGIKFHLQLIA